jgi:hypothetical protein
MWRLPGTRQLFLTCVLAIALVHEGAIAADTRANMGATFQVGEVDWLGSFALGPAGNRFEIAERGAPPITIAVPPGTVRHEIRARVGVDRGTFIPARGRAAGVVLVFATEPSIAHFEAPIAITVHLRSEDIQGIPVGYAILGTDRVKLLNMTWDRRQELTFYVIAPLTFSWVYDVSP